MKKTSRCGLGKGMGKGYKNLVLRDPHVHRMNAKGISMSDAMSMNRAKGQYFFSKGAMDFFNSKVETKGNLINDKYFITSEKFDADTPRKYTIRKFNKETGEVETVDKFQKFRSYQDAKDVAITLKAQITRIQGTNDKEGLARELQRLLNFRGYDARVYVEKGHIRVSDVRLSEKYLDEKGYNIKESYGGRKRRGRILNWENWVEVNDTINDVLDKMKVSANVQSLGGKFKIREGMERKTRDDWEHLAGENVGSMMYPVLREDDWRPEGIPRTKLKKRGYGYTVPKAVKKEYGLEAKGKKELDKFPVVMTKEAKDELLEVERKLKYLDQKRQDLYKTPITEKWQRDSRLRKVRANDKTYSYWYEKKQKLERTGMTGKQRAEAVKKYWKFDKTDVSKKFSDIKNEIGFHQSMDVIKVKSGNKLLPVLAKRTSMRFGGWSDNPAIDVDFEFRVLNDTQAKRLIK